MTVLCYHEIDPVWSSPMAVHPERFARHCAWLARHREVADAGEVARQTGPRHAVALTFDDGFAGNYHHALPVLRRFRLPTTVFVVAATLLEPSLPVNWVDEAPEQAPTTLTTDQILEMREAGVRFGSHSMAHHDLTRLDEAECERDLTDSREILEDLLSEPIRLLAYPRGRHAPHVRRAAGKAGYEAAFGLPESSETTGPLAIPRVGIYSQDGVRSLAIKSHPGYLRLRLGPGAKPLRGVARAARHLSGRTGEHR